MEVRYEQYDINDIISCGDTYWILGTLKEETFAEETFGSGKNSRNFLKKLSRISRIS